MKEETQQSQGNAGNHRGGVFASGRKRASGAKSDIETALCQRIAGTDLKKVLASQWNRKKIMKKAHAGRGLKTIWVIPVKMGIAKANNGGIPNDEKNNSSNDRAVAPSRFQPPIFSRLWTRHGIYLSRPVEQ
jgi:hypothetical protein